MKWIDQIHREIKYPHGKIKELSEKKDQFYRLNESETSCQQKIMELSIESSEEGIRTWSHEIFDSGLFVLSLLLGPRNLVFLINSTRDFWEPWREGESQKKKRFSPISRPFVGKREEGERGWGKSVNNGWCKRKPLTTSPPQRHYLPKMALRRWEKNITHKTSTSQNL